MEWSWGLLTAREREALSAVSRYPGRFTLGMARQALGPAAQTEWDAMELLSALVDKSVVLAVSGSRSVFRLLETTRLFAQERLLQDRLRRPASG
jgi:predicted ATPase